MSERIWHSKVVLEPESEEREEQGESAPGGKTISQGGCAKACPGRLRRILAIFFESFIPITV